MKFIAVLPLSELPPGSHRTVKAGRGSVALFNYNGTITALEHACLHKGGDLGEGFIQRLDRGARSTSPARGTAGNTTSLTVALLKATSTGRRFSRSGSRMA